MPLGQEHSERSRLRINLPDIVEALQRALERGAAVYAEMAGYDLTNDARHMMAPRSDGSVFPLGTRLRKGSRSRARKEEIEDAKLESNL